LAIVPPFVGRSLPSARGIDRPPHVGCKTSTVESGSIAAVHARASVLLSSGCAIMRALASRSLDAVGSREPQEEMNMKPFGCVLGLACLLAAVATDAGAEPAKGTLTYKSKSGAVVVDVKHAFLVKGPDPVTGKTIRRLVLSATDVGPALKKCGDMRCSDGGIGDGMTIDFDAGSRINYWFVAKDQIVQYSGTAEPASVKLTTDAPDRLAGRWDLDASASGGPVIKVEFDAPLMKTLAK
jgi:hypothetical protein